MSERRVPPDVSGGKVVRRLEEVSGGPLAGRTVVVTRPRDRARTMVAPLEALGARVLLVPSVEVVPPADREPLLRAARKLEQFDWVVFTSANGVRAFRRALDEARREAGGPGGAPRRCGVVGPATAEAVKNVGWKVELEPDDFTGQGLLEAFRRLDPGSGSRILLPLAEAAGEDLPRGLREAGLDVTEVVAYRSVPPSEAEVTAVREDLRAGAVDVCTFTSPSTARNFLDAVGPEALSAPAAAIGPVTAQAAREMGYDVAVTAPVHTAEALVTAVVDYLGSGGKEP